MNQFKLHKRKKREVWVVTVDAGKYTISDAHSMNRISEIFFSRSEAEAYAKEQGWKVV